MPQTGQTPHHKTSNRLVIAVHLRQQQRNRLPVQMVKQRRQSRGAVILFCRRLLDKLEVVDGNTERNIVFLAGGCGSRHFLENMLCHLPVAQRPKRGPAVICDSAEEPPVFSVEQELLRIGQKTDFSDAPGSIDFYAN